MPSLTHEALVELFRNRPQLCADLLAQIPGFSKIHLKIAESAAGTIQPTERRADLVLEGKDFIVVLEVQLGRDSSKRLSWPLYLASVHARYRKPVLLMVLCLDKAIAKWVAKPIHVGPGFVLYPMVIGPEQIPVVVETAEAAKDPELAVLSAMVHGKSAKGGKIAKALVPVLRELDEERARLYTDLVLMNLGAAARKEWEAWMLENYEYQSDFARKYVEKGRQEGRQEGRYEGRYSSIFNIFVVRNLPVSAEERARIQQCEDLDTLDRWLQMAITAESVEEVLR